MVTIVAGLLMSRTTPTPKREAVRAPPPSFAADEKPAMRPMDGASTPAGLGVAGPETDQALVSPLKDLGPPADVRPAAANWRSYPRALAAGVLGIVLTGVAVPLLARAVGGRRIGVGGSFFARLTLPIGLLAATILMAMVVRSRRAAPWWGWASHLGFVILLGGVVGSTFDHSAVTTIATGEDQVVAGLDVTSVGLDVHPGPRPGTTAVTLTLEVAGHRLEPGLVSYPERGGILAETDMVGRPWRDIQVVLLDARDDGRAVIEVRVKPLVQLIWLGALLVAAGAIAGAIAGFRRARGALSSAVVPSTIWRSRHEPAHT